MKTAAQSGTSEAGGFYVLQVIAEDLSAITESVFPMIGVPERIEVAVNEPDGPNYVSAPADLDATLRSLQDLTIAVVSLQTSTPGIQNVLLMAPNILGGRLSRWMGSIDFTTPAQNWGSVWSIAIRNTPLVAASVSLDDGIELSDEQLTYEKFPWQEPRLVIGAVRAANGEWITRENPNARW
jgi:hypothetical protein